MRVLPAGYALFGQLLTWQAAQRGRAGAHADRCYPSSSTCSRCGAVRTKLALPKREYTGTACGRSLDRDVNAARNLAAPARTPRPGAPPRQWLRLSCTSGASEPGEAKLPSAPDTLCGDGAAAFRPTGPGDATLPPTQASAGRQAAPENPRPPAVAAARVVSL
jgi:hypothetical protein